MDKLRKYKLNKINNHVNGISFYENFNLKQDLNNRDGDIDDIIYDSFWLSTGGTHMINFTLDKQLNYYEYFNKYYAIRNTPKTITEGHILKSGIFQIRNDIVFGSYSYIIESGFQFYVKLEAFINADVLKCVFSYPERISFKIKLNPKSAHVGYFNQISLEEANTKLGEYPAIKAENLI